MGRRLFDIIMMNISHSLAGKVATLAIVVLALLLVACSGSNAVAASEIQSVASKVYCVCGCNDILSQCDCDTAKQLTAQITKGLSSGHSEEQIIQDLVRQYGQRVLTPRSNQ